MHLSSLWTRVGDRHAIAATNYKTNTLHATPPQTRQRPPINIERRQPDAERDRAVSRKQRRRLLGRDIRSELRREDRHAIKVLGRDA